MSDAIVDIYKVVLKQKATIKLIRKSDLSMTFGCNVPDEQEQECITIPIK